MWCVATYVMNVYLFCTSGVHWGGTFVLLPVCTGQIRGRHLWWDITNISLLHVKWKFGIRLIYPLTAHFAFAAIPAGRAGVITGALIVFFAKVKGWRLVYIPWVVVVF